MKPTAQRPIHSVQSGLVVARAESAFGTCKDVLLLTTSARALPTMYIPYVYSVENFEVEVCELARASQRLTPTHCTGLGASCPNA